MEKLSETELLAEAEKAEALIDELREKARRARLMIEMKKKA
jgi:hypothetical protein